MQVKIKLLEGGKMPTKGTPYAAAYDCYASQTVEVGYTPVLIGLGFAIELPEGYHAEIVPRSSTGLKTNLRQPNCVGIIDSDYRGEVKVIYELKPLLGVNRDAFYPYKGFTVLKGDRIAQMLVKKNEDVELVEVDELSETERGSGGFGSTGLL